MIWNRVWVFLCFKYVFFSSQAGEANGDSNLEPGAAEDLNKKQQQLEELTEKLENAQRTQKQLFLIVFQVRKNMIFVCGT